MNPLVLGIDISDLGTGLSYYADEENYRFPTVICKEKDGQEWYVGEEAYAMALSGRGIMTDKLLSLSLRGGTATLNGIKYMGKELLKIFFEKVIKEVTEKKNRAYPERLVISVQKIDKEIIELITDCFVSLGYLKSNISVISRCESFIYYVMSCNKEVWNNQVGLFDLSDINLVYYELRVKRNARNMIVYAEYEKLEESFNIDIISHGSGGKLADKILTSCAERLLQKKIFSSVFLTGRGFDNIDWAENFIKQVRSRRKVFSEPSIFSQGACYKGVDLASDKPLFNFVCICDGRLDTSVSINIEKNEKQLGFSIADAGDAWYDKTSELRLIPDKTSEIEFVLAPIDMKVKKIVKVELDFLPDRPEKTRRIDLKTSFKDSKTLILDIKDAGFGEIYKAGNSSKHKEVRLWD